MFTAIRNFLAGKKTYLVAFAGIATAVAAYASGSISINELVSAIFAAVGAMTLRAGSQKAEDAAK